MTSTYVADFEGTSASLAMLLLFSTKASCGLRSSWLSLYLCTLPEQADCQFEPLADMLQQQGVARVQEGVFVRTHLVIVDHLTTKY